MKVIPERVRGEVVSKTAAPVPSVRVMDVNVLVEVKLAIIESLVKRDVESVIFSTVMPVKVIVPLVNLKSEDV